MEIVVVSQIVVSLFLVLLALIPVSYVKGKRRGIELAEKTWRGEK